MSKNLMISLFTLVVGIALVSITLTALYRPDATATMISSVTTLLGLLSGFAVLIHGLAKVNDKVGEVHKQTNGTLSKKDDELKAAQETILALTAAIYAKDLNNGK